MSKYVHILIKPDAFLRNIVHEIIDSFHNYNFEIIAVNIIMPNKSLLDVMYDKEFKWEYDYYCHNKRLYGLGPSLSVIIKYNSNIDYKMIKGASLPIYPCMNSIRYLYGVKDRCLNLIHIADTLQESLNEINVIYGNILSEELRTDTFNLKKCLTLFFLPFLTMNYIISK